MSSTSALHGLLAGDVVCAARGLLGCRLIRRFPDGSSLTGRIVETEAYHQLEPGCHAFKGRTPRNASMFERPGLLYVYRIYGIYFCANIVCESEGTAAAVLIRGLEPIETPDLRCAGPGLLCSALQISTDQNGIDLLDGAAEMGLLPGSLKKGEQLGSTRRIGFSFEDDKDWRFHVLGNPHVSKGRPGMVRKLRHNRE